MTSLSYGSHAHSNTVLGLVSASLRSFMLLLLLLLTFAKRHRFEPVFVFEFDIELDLCVAWCELLIGFRPQANEMFVQGVNQRK